MHKTKIIFYGLLHAVATTAYVAAVALLMHNGEALFGATPNKVLTATSFLLLFVVSAAITGSLVFGRPIFWYLNGRKREAVRLAFFTILFLAVVVVAIFLSLVLWNTGV